MSQHKVIVERKGIPVEVLVGWDSPLNRFFLVVEPTREEDRKDENDGYIYTNLSDKVLDNDPIHYQDLGYFKFILENLRIQIPDTIWEAVKQDKLFNR